MMSQKRGLAMVAIVAIATAFLGHASYWKPAAAVVKGPRTTAEVIAIAQKLGLHYRSDRWNGDTTTNRLVVSKSVITWEHATSLTYRRWESEDWRDTVAVYRGLESDYYHMGEMVAWGNFCLLGDAALIRKLLNVEIK